MGGQVSVGCNVGQDSEREPGTKCVTTDALEDYSAGAVLEEALEFLRYPLAQQTEPVLKGVEVEEHGPDDFTVKVILDGRKLQGMNLGKPDGSGADRVDFWARITADRQAMTITQSNYVGSGKFGAWADDLQPNLPVGSVSKTSFLQDPLRLEFYIQMGEHLGGERLADGRATAAFKPVLESILPAAKERKVKLRPNQKSLRDEGKLSVVSEPMGEVTTFDDFWERLIDTLQNPEKAEAVVISPEEFRVKHAGPMGGELITTYKHSKERGEVTTESHNARGEPVGTAAMILHREPLVFEAWNVDAGGNRKSHRRIRALYQFVVDRALESGWFW